MKLIEVKLRRNEKYGEKEKRKKTKYFKRLNCTYLGHALPHSSSATAVAAIRSAMANGTTRTRKLVELHMTVVLVYVIKCQPIR